MASRRARERADAQGDRLRDFEMNKICAAGTGSFLEEQADHLDAAIVGEFSRLAASRVKRMAPDLPLVKYVAPQFWASRPRRVKKLADLYDGTLVLFDFEVGPIRTEPS